MKKKSKKIPSYAFGLQAVSSAVDSLGSGISALSKDNSNLNAFAESLSASGKGFQIGSSFGPWGAAAGAIIGGGLGLVGGIRKKNAINREIRRKETRQSTEFGNSIAAQAEQEYYNENDPVYTYANGGVTNNNLAFVDNNEVLRDIYGNLTEVPNTKKGTDNHLINATTLDSVLSDKIKKPSTNKTFAEEGKKLVKMTKKSKGTDRFAEASNRLNEYNANKQYEALLAEQEKIKASKGIKPKKKDIAPAYEDGTSRYKYSSRIQKYADEKRNSYNTLLKPGEIGIKLRDTSLDAYDGITGETILLPNENMSTPVSNVKVERGNAAVTSKNPYILSGAYNNFGRTEDLKMPAGQGSWLNFNNNLNVNPTEYINAAVTAPNITAPSVSINKPNVSVNKPNVSVNNAPVVNKDFVTKPLEAGAITPIKVNNVRDNKLTIDKIPVVAKDNNLVNPSSNSGFNFGNLLELSPTLYNLIQGLKGPEQEELVTNPYSRNIINSMARRKFNIEDIKNANARQQAISRYNRARLNANTGANIAAGVQDAVNAYAANANLYSTKQNMENNYLADYANTLNNIGSQYAAAKTLFNDNSSRNRAAARSFTGTALSQLGQWSQNKTKMANEQARDNAMFPLMLDYLSQGLTNDKLQNLIKLYSKNG